MSREATKRSFQYCAETCPDFDRLVDKIKDATTNKLREALANACQDLIDAEEEADRLRDEIRERDELIENLKDEIGDLQSKVEA